MMGAIAAVDTVEEDSEATAVVDLTPVDTVEVDTAAVDAIRIAAVSPSAGGDKVLAGAEDA